MLQPGASAALHLTRFILAHQASSLMTGMATTTVNNAVTPPAGVLTFAYGVPAGVTIGMTCTVTGDPNTYTVTAVTANTVTLATAPAASAIPAFWTFNASNANYATPQTEWLSSFTDCNGHVRWYLDLNHNNVYDAGVDFIQEWPSASHLYQDLNANAAKLTQANYYDMYQPGAPCLSASNFETTFFLDLAGNGVAGPLQPCFTPSATAAPDYGARNDINYPLGVETTLGVAPVTGMSMASSMFDLGWFSLSSPYTLPPLSATLQNSGNQTLNNVTVQGMSFPTITDGQGNSTITSISNYLYRTGMSSVLYNAPTAPLQISVRPVNETQPFYFNTALSSGWTLLKSPVGSSADYGRAFNLSIPGINSRQPIGTYTGTLNVTSGPGSDNSTALSVRVEENRFSQVVPAALGSDPRPPFDGSLIGNFWLNYLTGTKNWPAAAVLPLGEGYDDLGVWISSNTPLPPSTPLLNPTPAQLIADLLPTSTTDTNIFFRRVKHLIFTNITFNGNNISLPAGAGATVRARNANDETCDLLILRYQQSSLTPLSGMATVAGSTLTFTNSPPAGVYAGMTTFLAGSAMVYTVTAVTANTVTVSQAPAASATAELWNFATAPWYGKVTEVVGDTITVTPISLWQWPYPQAQTVVEVLAHPWVPVISAANMNVLRQQMADPGVPGDHGPSPIACNTPSVTVDPNPQNNPWLIWSVAATRSVTHVNGNGQTVQDHIPFSYLAFTQFDPNNPTAANFNWVAPTTAQANAQAVQLTDREKPIFLPAVGVANQGLVLYQGGNASQDGLYYAYSNVLLPDPMTYPNSIGWTIDQSIGVLNQSFTSSESPQVWADTGTNTAVTPALTGVAESPMRNLNLIFQARGNDGNIDLYYARLQVNMVQGVPTLLPLAIGTATDTLVANAADTTFTSQYHAWTATGLSITLVNQDTQGNKTNYSLTLNTGDTQQQYQLTTTDGALVISVDPYHGIVHILRDTVGIVVSVTLSGAVRTQRLTTNLGADKNPCVSVERWRYFGQPAASTSLTTNPRIWLFWTRQQSDSLARRIYYQTWRMPTNGAGPLTDETRATTGAATTVDMPERLLPLEVPGQDGTLFITRMSLAQQPSPNSPESGLWVLTTGNRSLFPPYPDLNTLTNGGLNTPPTMHDLFLQVVDMPEPDN